MTTRAFSILNFRRKNDRESEKRGHLFTDLYFMYLAFYVGVGTHILYVYNTCYRPTTMTTMTSKQYLTSLKNEDWCVDFRNSNYKINCKWNRHSKIIYP